MADPLSMVAVPEHAERIPAPGDAVAPDLVRGRLPRALRLTRKGRAFFGRLGVKVPF